ncbi:MAG: hypothetical protein WD068_00565 [Candidatus Babeliales bacterium]
MKKLGGIILVMVFFMQKAGATPIAIYKKEGNKEVRIGSFYPCKSFEFSNREDCKILMTDGEIVAAMQNGYKLFGDLRLSGSDMQNGYNSLGDQPFSGSVSFTSFTKKASADMPYFTKIINNTTITYSQESVQKDDLLDYD